MSNFVADVRYALRQVVRQPLFSGTVVLLMALGIAGNAAVFRVFNGLFLRPLPFPQAEQLVDLDETAPEWDLPFLNIAYRDYAHWSENAEGFQAMSVFSRGGGNLVGEGSVSRVRYLLTTHTMDEVLRIDPVVGRFYGPEEDHPDGPRAALLSHGFWEREFGGDTGVVGRVVSLDGLPVEILGVLPVEAAFLAEVDMWLPLRQTAAEFTGWGLSGLGRLSAGVTMEAAQRELTAIHASMLQETGRDEPSAPVVNGLRERYLGDFRLGTEFLLGAVLIVLLIACANIAGLMFARSFARGPEISVRLALGAPRSRIIRQLLTEGFTLAILGGVIGTALGAWTSSLLVAGMSTSFPAWVSFDLDRSFFVFVVGMSAVSALLFALLPAWRASAQSAPGSSSRSAGSRARTRATGALVAGEVALALALLVLGGLSVADARAVASTDPGYDVEGVISYQMALPSERYETDEARLAFAESHLERIRALPGVESAAIASTLPLGGHWGTFFFVAGAPVRGAGEANPVVLNRLVTEGYFETMGVELVAGRVFDAFDGRGEGEHQVIVNETFVRTHLSHLGDPVGARVALGTSDPGDEGYWMTVIGVTRDVMHYGLDEEMRPGVYQPWPQNPVSGFAVVMRTRGDLAAITAGVRTSSAEFDPEVPIYSLERTADELRASLFTRRATSWLFGSFSTVALLLAVAGIYGVIAYGTGQRAQEISIRMAMGARRTDVVAQIVRQGMVVVAVGLGIGLVVALVSSRAVSGMLLRVNALDPIIYGGVIALLLVVAFVANFLPARRAVRVDPMRALRGE
jgi:predicted permease